MEQDDYKQIMYANYEGFGRIIWNLEAEIVILWTEGNLEATYGRIKQLFAHVEAHLKDKKAGDYFIPEFEKIEKYIYDPINEKYSTLAKYKKLTNYKEAGKLMFEVYRKLKWHMKESGLEAFYGVPSQIITDFKRKDNINKVFGRNKK